MLQRLVHEYVEVNCSGNAYKQFEVFLVYQSKLLVKIVAIVLLLQIETKKLLEKVQELAHYNSVAADCLFVQFARSVQQERVQRESNLVQEETLKGKRDPLQLGGVRNHLFFLYVENVLASLLHSLLVIAGEFAL